MEIQKLVGNTPVIRVNGVNLKIEYVNPTGSHKDRIAMYMLDDARKVGIKKGRPVIEFTSGNTGISLAWASRFFGYEPIILLPSNIVKEKMNFIRAFGAKVILVNPDEDGHTMAEELAKEKGGFFLRQTENMANFHAHYETTASELYSQVDDLECFIMGAGTGGTIYGIGKYLKEKNEKIRVVLLIPKGSYLQEEFFGKREEDRQLLEGFSYHSLSPLLKKALDEDIIDDIRVVDSKMSINGVKNLLAEGVPGGFTSGAGYYYAQKISKEKGCRAATLVADSIIRYSSLIELLL